MLIYRSVGASAIAAIMAAHRQPVRNHRNSGVCSAPHEIDEQAAAIPDHRQYWSGGSGENGEPASASSDRGAR